MAASKADGLVDPRLGKRLLAETRLRRAELRIERAIKAALGRHKAHALAQLRAQHLAAAGPPDAFGLTTWDASVDDGVEPAVADSLRDFAASTAQFLALPPETRAEILGKIDVPAQTADFVERVRTVGTDVAGRLTDTLSVGIGKGESIEALSARVSDVFDIGDNLAERIARTETHGAAEQTTFASAGAIADAGYQLTKTWISTQDDRTRPDHVEADGQIVGMDEPFEVGGDELMFPGDDSLGADVDQLANCRCSCTYDMADGVDGAIDEEQQIEDAESENG